MSMRCLAVLALLAPAIPLALAQPLEVPAMLHDAETTEHWSSGITLVPDGKTGQAVRYAIPGTGNPAGPRLDLNHLSVPFTADSRLTFWYRFSGKGSSSLHIKLMDPDYAKGWQATWQIGGNHPADGLWHLGEVDLATSWMQWGDTPVPNTRCIMFRTQAPDGAEVALDLDDIQLVPRCLEVQAEPARIVGGKAIVPLVVRNTGNRALAIIVSGGTRLATLDLPDQGERRMDIEVDLPQGWLGTARPLEQTVVRLAVVANDRPWSLVALAVPVAKPITLPPHPRRRANAAEIAAGRERWQTIAW
ncbi:MAG: hypothetical protein RBU25_18050, partial [Lentisphaeria bacterium]|nr:hypothetical protein [Lentisphaeria bacterium]